MNVLWPVQGLELARGPFGEGEEGAILVGGRDGRRGQAGFIGIPGADVGGNIVVGG